MSNSIDGVRCPKCLSPIHVGARFCKSCGTAIPDSSTVRPITNRCGACDSELSIGAKFCRTCGTAVSDSPTEKPNSHQCNQCGTILAPDALFCRLCGTAVPVSQTQDNQLEEDIIPIKEESGDRCNKCGALLPDGAMFCRSCGTKVSNNLIHEDEQDIVAQPSKDPTEPQCSSCGEILPQGAMFCRSCGTAVSNALTDETEDIEAEQEPTYPKSADDTKLRCGECGAALPAEAVFCNVCGNKVTSIPIMVQNGQKVQNQSPVSVIQCSIYGKELPPDSQICSYCDEEQQGVDIAYNAGDPTRKKRLISRIIIGAGGLVLVAVILIFVIVSQMNNPENTLNADGSEDSSSPTGTVNAVSSTTTPKITQPPIDHSQAAASDNDTKTVSTSASADEWIAHTSTYTLYFDNDGLWRMDKSGDNKQIIYGEIGYFLDIDEEYAYVVTHSAGKGSSIKIPDAIMYSYGEPSPVSTDVLKINIDSGSISKVVQNVFDVYYCDDTIFFTTDFRGTYRMDLIKDETLVQILESEHDQLYAYIISTDPIKKQLNMVLVREESNDIWEECHSYSLDGDYIGTYNFDAVESYIVTENGYTIYKDDDSLYSVDKSGKSQRLTQGEVSYYCVVGSDIYFWKMKSFGIYNLYKVDEKGGIESAVNSTKAFGAYSMYYYNDFFYYSADYPVVGVYRMSMDGNTNELMWESPEGIDYRPCFADNLMGIYDTEYSPLFWFDELIDLIDMNTIDPISGGQTNAAGTANSAIKTNMDENGVFAAGDGSALSPYIIITEQQLNNVGDYLGSNFKLGRDLALGGKEFKTIGSGAFSSGKWNAQKGFQGVFDGNGYTVSGLNIRSDAQCYGLFAFIGSNGVVRNLVISGNATTTKDDANNALGVLAGYSEGYIENCYVTAIVKGTGKYAMVGCLVGTNDGMIVDCDSDGSVNASGEYAKAGGIVGLNLPNGLLVNCYNHASVISDYSAGELFGWNDNPAMD